MFLNAAIHHFCLVGCLEFFFFQIPKYNFSLPLQQKKKYYNENFKDKRKKMWKHMCRNHTKISPFD